MTSLVLGLALQPILGNFFAGVVLSLEQPFRINDWIKVGEHRGKGGEGHLAHHPPAHARQRHHRHPQLRRSPTSEVLNYYYPHPLHLERIYVGVHYRTPPYRVRQALLDVADRVEAVLKKPTPSVYLFSFDDSAITYELRVWIEDIANKPRINSHVKSEIWEEFKRRGITIPFPIRTLEIEPRAGRLEVARPPKPVAVDPGQPPPARLYVYRGPDRGESVALENGPVTVGRSSSCTLTLQEPHASKEHLRVEFRDGGYLARDLGSQNGTRINTHALDEQVLTHLDHLVIGDTVIIFEGEPENG